MDSIGRYRLGLLLGILLLILSLAVSGWSFFNLVEVPWGGLQFNRAFPPGDETPQLPQAIPGLRPGAVTQVVPGAPADTAGIRIGDRILAVDGIPVHEIQQLRRHTHELRVGDVLIYRVARGEERFDAWVLLDTPLHTTTYTVGLISGFAGALVFAVLGLLVVLKKREDRRARLFYWLCVLLAVTYLLVSGISSVQLSGVGVNDPAGWDPWQWALLGVYAAAGLMVAPLLLHFAMIFPHRRALLRDHPWVLGWIYALPLLQLSFVGAGAALFLTHKLLPQQLEPYPIPFVALCLLGLGLAWRLFRARRHQGWKAALLDHPVAGLLLMVVSIFALVEGIDTLAPLLGIDGQDRGVAIVVALLVLGAALLGLTVLFYPVATCTTLYRTYRESGPEERAQVRWPLWGIIVALTGVTLFGLLSLTVAFFGVGFAHVSAVGIDVVQKLFYLLIPISFAVAILKYRLMDIEFILRKTVVYSVLTGLVLMLYLVLAGGLGGLVVRYAGIQSQWVVIGTTLVVAAVLVPVRNTVQGIVERSFFRERRDYPQALREINAGLQRVNRVQEAAELLAEQVQQAVRSRAVAIFLRSGSGDTLRVAAKVGLPDEAFDQLSIPNASALLRTEQPVLAVAGADLPPSLIQTARRARAQWLVPIRRNAELLGAISLGGKVSREPFGEEDHEFCVAAAAQTAVTLENLSARQRGAEVERALEIQRHLLPSQIPRVEGYDLAARWQPSRTVAGDYYDVLRLGQDELGLCIADATGKGIPAALLMSNLQAAVRALAPGVDSPAELCRQLNQILSSSASRSMFISFFYARLELGSGRLRYSNAGHNQPLLLRAAGGVERLGEGGMVLGAFPDREYVEGELVLGAGDRLLLFTDGITEAESPHGEEFGEQRLLDVLRKHRRRSATELESAVMQAVAAFSPAELRDDATLLVVVVTGPRSR